MARRFPDLFPRETPKGFILRAAAVWTAVVVLFLVLGVRYSAQEELEISLNRARDAFRKDVAYRTWATERGGVYVPLDAKTSPNPYLENIPDRDVATTSGKRLTLVNPAYMTRMVHELGAKEYGLKGHITSLNPLRPENAPDAWEEKALRITTRCLGQNRAELAVSDTGDGMPPEVLARAMEPFFTTKAAGKGTGLGLAMVYGTMKAHGGTMELSSVPGEGTRVTLVFPTLSRPLPPEPAVEAGAKAQRLPRRILLVDDDELIQASVPPLLEDLGHHVEVASGGLQALRLLETGLQVDLVILDLNMPGMSGRETLVRLRMLRPELPVVIASGFVGEAGDEAAPFGSGVKVLKKPFSLGELQEAVDSFSPR